MLRPKPQPASGPRSTVAIKRVMRQGGRFTCGVCRKVYQQEAAAEQCLARCLQAHVNPATTVAAVPGAGGKRFRCHFCKRVYESRDSAQQCATACRSVTQEKIEAETAVKARVASPGSASAPARVPVAVSAPAAPEPVKKARTAVRRDQGHKFLRDGRKLVCRKCGSESKTLDLVIACYDSHVAPPKTVKPVAAAPAPAPAAEPAAARSTGNDAEKFSRDGAKYVCRNCHKKFFTRDDVVACFDAHGGASAPALAAVAAPVATTAAAPEPGPVTAAAGDADKFFRDGARYVCRSCQKKHFTRGDVLACFDSHG